MNPQVCNGSSLWGSPPSVVDRLVMKFRDGSLSEEDQRECLGITVDQVLQACSRDMEEEETMLLVTILLARKVANHTPSLLCKVFHTTVNFINQNLLTYMRNLVRNEMDCRWLQMVQLVPASCGDRAQLHTQSS
ncbi:BH3-interacting domain death agonist-like [Phyllostomus hastatus]|uniref:BH3-interacting domain death agonist-like n=1 Tax=Phyllostomus hastatus TaxID=9423 RepID=UPI001E6821E1|nr:BH3-interacting domain death agonist-like [Phyllostomus hastatus]